MRAALAVALIVVAACAAPQRGADRAPDVVPVTQVADGASPRVLVVVAHPDDEIAFAGLLWKTAAVLGGACDVFTITNGEGGFKYATLAAREHGLDLTDETVGRRELPAIRRRELAAGCRHLGVREIAFLGEKDHRYTQDLTEVLGPAPSPWDLGRVAAQLDARLREGVGGRPYDHVLVHLPTPGTHAHHVAATVLAVEAVRRLPPERRPCVLAGRVATDGETPPPFAPPAFAPSAPRDAVELAPTAPFVFDRRAPFGHQDRLDARIVVNWAIAEHRTQGTMQLLMGRGDREEYFVVEGGAPAGPSVRGWFERLAERPFEVRTYAPSAGTNAR